MVIAGSSVVVLICIGGIEALYGAYVFLFTGQALTMMVGQLLSVNAAVGSPALLPMTAQVGVLRLAIGILVIVVASSAESTETTFPLQAALVAHACLLQPFVTICRSHSRMPIRLGLVMSVIEGLTLVLAMASDFDFNANEIILRPACTASVCFLVIGALLTVIALMREMGRGRAVTTDEGSVQLVSGSSGATPLLFDENRHQLSPSAKRLLA